MVEELQGAVALVAQGETLMRLENETMTKVALQRPRDEAKVLAMALKELEMIPEEAATAYYSIPYKDRQGDEEKIVHVEGPSIKAAMSLARRWGNCSATARFLSEDAEGFNIEGVFLDQETNFRHSRPMRVSKFLKRRDGRVQVLTPDRMTQKLSADVSKAIRGAILGGIPAPIVNAYFKKAKELAAKSPLGRKATKSNVDAVVKGFEPWKITREMLEEHLGRKASEWTGDHVGTLRGVWNAINDGQIAPEEAFPQLKPKAETGDNGKQTVTPDSLAGANVKGKNGVELGQPSPIEQARITVTEFIEAQGQKRIDDYCKKQWGVTDWKTLSLMEMQTLIAYLNTQQVLRLADSPAQGAML